MYWERGSFYHLLKTFSFEPFINPSSGASRNISLPPSDEFSLGLWKPGMLKRSTFSTRTISILARPCHLLFYAFASSIAIAAEEQGHWLVPAKAARANVRVQTAFAENAAKPFGELSLEPTGQLPQSLQLSKYHTKFWTF